MLKQQHSAVDLGTSSTSRTHEAQERLARDFEIEGRCLLVLYKLLDRKIILGALKAVHEYVPDLQRGPQ